MRLAILFLLGAAAAFAGSWSGFLVDSACYANEQTNTNKDPTTVDRDMMSDVRRCAPTANTKDFGLVLGDWSMTKFDSSSNAKAAHLVRSQGTKSTVAVRISGNLDNHIMTVDSIAINH